MLKLLRPEGNRGGSSSECDSRIGRGRDCEIFKASQFVFGSRQRLPRPRRSRSNTLLSSNLSRCQHIYRWRISSREISRAISATDFYAAITPRFSFLFSSSCASFLYAHSHIHLFSSERGRWAAPRTANPLRAPYRRRIVQGDPETNPWTSTNVCWEPVRIMDILRTYIVFSQKIQREN